MFTTTIAVSTWHLNERHASRLTEGQPDHLPDDNADVEDVQT